MIPISVTDNNAVMKMLELLGLEPDDIQNCDAKVTLGDCDEVVLVGFYAYDAMYATKRVAWVYKDNEWEAVSASDYGGLI